MDRPVISIHQAKSTVSITGSSILLGSPPWMDGATRGSVGSDDLESFTRALESLFQRQSIQSLHIFDADKLSRNHFEVILQQVHPSNQLGKVDVQLSDGIQSLPEFLAEILEQLAKIPSKQFRLVSPTTVYPPLNAIHRGMRESHHQVKFCLAWANSDGASPTHFPQVLEEICRTDMVNHFYCLINSPDKSVSADCLSKLFGTTRRLETLVFGIDTKPSSWTIEQGRDASTDLAYQSIVSNKTLRSIVLIFDHDIAVDESDDDESEADDEAESVLLTQSSALFCKAVVPALKRNSTIRKLDLVNPSRYDLDFFFSAMPCMKGLRYIQIRGSPRFCRDFFPNWLETLAQTTNVVVARLVVEGIWDSEDISDLRLPEGNVESVMKEKRVIDTLGPINAHSTATADSLHHDSDELSVDTSFHSDDDNHSFGGYVSPDESDGRSISTNETPLFRRGRHSPFFRGAQRWEQRILLRNRSMKLAKRFVRQDPSVKDICTALGQCTAWECDVETFSAEYILVRHGLLRHIVDGLRMQPNE